LKAGIFQAPQHNNGDLETESANCRSDPFIYFSLNLVFQFLARI